MDTRTTTIPAAFSKEGDQEFQRFLILMDRLQTEMMRMEMAMTDVKIGYAMLTQTLKEYASQK
jgi:hypothetical protein